VNELSEIPRQSNADAYIDLKFVPEKERIQRLSLLLPIPVLINSVIYTLEDIGQPFIRINGWPGFLRRPVAEIALAANDQENEARLIFDALNWPCQIVPDIPGMISARVIAMIFNEAYFTFQEKTSTKAEIDIAMKLGTNYPLGPFEWSSQIGLMNIYELLLLLSHTISRYRVAESLELEALGIKNKQNGKH